MALTESAKKLQIGDKAPHFELPGIDDKTYSLENFRGQPLLVIFMCNHCPYVKAKISSIVKLHETFKGKVTVIGVNSNDPEYEGEGMKNMRAFAKECNISFPYVLDESQDTAKAYGATCTPDPFLFDADGKLVYHGRIDNALTLDSIPTENIMETNITKLLKGEKIEKNFMPSMGCSIKWKVS